MRGGDGADHAVCLLAVAVEQEGGDRGHSVTLRDARRGVRVDLGDFEAPGQIPRELLYYGRDLPTGPAPGRPHIHEDGEGGFADDGLERVVVGLHEPG